MNTMAHGQEFLEETFGFSRQDIKANEKGNITPEQIERLKKQQEDNIETTWFGYWFIATVSLFGVAINVYREDDISINFLLSYIGFVMFVRWLIQQIIKFYQKQKHSTIETGKVHSIEGYIEFISMRPGNKTYWYIRIGDKEFQFPFTFHYIDPRESGTEGQRAILYFTSPWIALLSIKLLTR